MGRPSMTALLAVLAVAGYQHRDRLAEMLGIAGRGRGPRDEAGRGGGTHVEGDDPVLGRGLAELADCLRQSGQGETAASWIGKGANRPLDPYDLERAIGPETLETLSRRTGLPRQEVLARLARDLPDAVDRYTPEGRLPDA